MPKVLNGRNSWHLLSGYFQAISMITMDIKTAFLKCEENLYYLKKKRH